MASAFDFDSDRLLVRSNFTNETGNISSYNFEEDPCRTDEEWMPILILIGLILGVVTSSVYLIVAFRNFDTLIAKFPFLNNFLLASFMNLLSTGIFGIASFNSHCWHAGRLLCKVLPTILDASENLVTFFIVATILYHGHPYVHSFFSKNAKFRKRTTMIILWITAMIFSIPEMVIWDVEHLGGDSYVCSLMLLEDSHFYMYFIKGLVVEYLLPLLLLIVTSLHAFVVSSTTNQTLAESHSINGETDRQEEHETQYPSIRMTSVVIGVVFFVLKSPYYLSAIFYIYVLFLFSLIFYPIPSIVAPVLVLLTSSIHRKRLRETKQTTASCIARGRIKNKRLLPTSGDEETLQENVELKDK